MKFFSELPQPTDRIIEDDRAWRWPGGGGVEKTEFLCSSQDLDHLLHHTYFRTLGNFQVPNNSRIILCLVIVFNKRQERIKRHQMSQN